MSENEEAAVAAEPAGGGPSTTDSTGRLIFDEELELDGSSGLTVTIVEAIAGARDLRAVDLVPRIDDAVDTDGLERIFRSHTSLEQTGRVTVFFCDCRIVLESDGRLRIFDTRTPIDR